MNQLSGQDQVLFFALWTPLLNYANSKLNLAPGELFLGKPNSQSAFQVANAIWDDRSLIDEFLASVSDMPKEHQEIVRSWKRSIPGMFILVRNLNSGSIFFGDGVSGGPDAVYRVLGLASPLEELFPNAMLPVALITALMPFRDVIVTDGIFAMYDMSFRGDIKNSMKRAYKRAKDEGRVITQL